MTSQGSAVHPHACVHHTAHVYGARVEAGARVGAHVMLLPGARVEAGAHVGAYSIVDVDAIVTTGTHVPAHSHVPPATVATPTNAASFYVSEAALEYAAYRTYDRKEDRR